MNKCFMEKFKILISLTIIMRTVIFFIAFVLLLSACNVSEQPEELICNPPYIRHAMDCCLDLNVNNIY